MVYGEVEVISEGLWPQRCQEKVQLWRAAVYHFRMNLLSPSSGQTLLLSRLLSCSCDSWRVCSEDGGSGFIRKWFASKSLIKINDKCGIFSPILSRYIKRVCEGTLFGRWEAHHKNTAIFIVIVQRISVGAKSWSCGVTSVLNVWIRVQDCVVGVSLCLTFFSTVSGVGDSGNYRGIPLL